MPRGEMNRKKMIRMSEIINLKFFDYDGGAHRVKIPKKEAKQLERKDLRAEIFDFDYNHDAGLLIITPLSSRPKKKEKKESDEEGDED